jgi:hypothetical protein
LLQNDLAANAYAAWHGNIEEFGLWNGNFEIGPGSRSPDGWPEGWELYPDNATSTIARVTGGLCGAYRMKGGNTNQAVGGYIRSLRYLPVDENRDYYISGAFIADTAAETVSLGVECYNAAKASLGTRWVLAAYAPGAATWQRRQHRIGPAGDAQFFAGTRYARVIVYLQGNAALAGYAYCDNIQFREMTACYSSGLSYITAFIIDGATQTFNAQAYTLYPASGLTITLEEESRIIYSYYFSGYNNAVRTGALYGRVYVDGAADSGIIDVRVGQAVANTYQNICLTCRCMNTYARGAHTIDLRLYVINAGDTFTAMYLHGLVYAIRRF